VEGPDWDEELKTYTACAIAPPTIVHALSKAQLLHRGCKIILVSSEAGSLALRHPTEGGGNYAHHASKAALNMVGRLLAMDLKDSGVIVSIVHPGFMKTDMTKNVGFDKFYESGNAVEPETAAKSLVEWIDALDASKSGEFWAPRGADDIGTASEILGKRLPTPLQLPW
jgi:NAD(P)-dependent dehydrogenase (short-subunit alcohol dehydrogenase family)